MCEASHRKQKLSFWKCLKRKHWHNHSLSPRACNKAALGMSDPAGRRRWRSCRLNSDPSCLCEGATPRNKHCMLQAKTLNKGSNVQCPRQVLLARVFVCDKTLLTM